MKTQRFIGEVKFFDKTKGFGFIKCDELGRDFFFHYSKLLNPTDMLEEGDNVSFEIGENRKGECAANIERI